MTRMTTPAWMAAPTGVTLLPSVFDAVSTEFTFATADVCLRYSERERLDSGLDRAALRLFQVRGDLWSDVTTGPYADEPPRVCGRVERLSTFAIGAFSTGSPTAVTARVPPCCPPRSVRCSHRQFYVSRWSGQSDSHSARLMLAWRRILSSRSRLISP